MLLVCSCEKNPANTDGGKEEEKNPEVLATDIRLNKTLLEFKALNETETLSATVVPANSTDVVAWSSSDPSVAYVADGVVTSVAPGSAEIMATCGKVSAKCAVTIDIAADYISLDKLSIMLRAGDTEKLTATLEPSYSNETVVWSSTDPSVATVQEGVVTAIAPGTARIHAKIGKRTAKCDIVVIESFSFKAVDLGLSVKWANANVGADRDEAYGDYYAWGETTTKDEYDWSTYKWFVEDGFTWLKYCSTDGWHNFDGKTVLEPEDDAASVSLGGNWRMPTREDWKELMDNCTWEWTTLFGVKGKEITSSINGNSIFLPAAGYWYGTEVEEDGQTGAYWSSSLSDDAPNYAYGICFPSDTNWAMVFSTYRFCGCPIRAVTE